MKREEAEVEVVMPSRSVIARLPREIREELNRRLMDGGFAGYSSLSVWLRKQGYYITRSEIKDYGNKLEQRLEAVRLATAQARAVVAASPEDDNRMSEALIRLVQHHLFNILVELNPQDPKQADLRAIARMVAELGRSSIMQRKFAEEMKEKVAGRVNAATAKVMDVAAAAAANGNGGGLSEEGEAEIRRALLEITK